MKNCLFVISVLLLGVCLSSAANLYDWAGDPEGTVVTFDDPDNDQTEDSRNIDMLWYASDASNHYFRMDLIGAPTQNSDQFAAEYSLQIDYMDGGAGNADSDYVSINLTGIDALVDMHYTLVSGFDEEHIHFYDPVGVPNSPFFTTAGVVASGGSVDQTDEVLQWCIPMSELSFDGEFMVYGVTYDIDGQGETFDLTEAMVVPEPATMLLLSIGGAAVVRLRK